MTKRGDVLDPLSDAGEEEVDGELSDVPHTNGRDHDRPFPPFDGEFWVVDHGNRVLGTRTSDVRITGDRVRFQGHRVRMCEDVCSPARMHMNFSAHAGQPLSLPSQGLLGRISTDAHQSEYRDLLVRLNAKIAIESFSDETARCIGRPSPNGNYR